ncbi:Protein involved in stability of MscS mechanosensitive channel [Salmonella enterica subsp. arizonae]|uniref:Protein involved in stability of MscS mechanosensitive channel n=1 Tax=Salmonella enterica subsp. arizonae TaxID=59203 RepID=A0A2X4W303_SALER|nr:Protein involved in stability of MscS mechanosensitive channel [Salmonella enterica subsp. arizonae]
MRARHIDATVADFLSALVRYGVIAFTLIAAWGAWGFKPLRLLPSWAPLV